MKGDASIRCSEQEGAEINFCNCISKPSCTVNNACLMSLRNMVREMLQSYAFLLNCIQKKGEKDGIFSLGKCFMGL